MDIFSGIFILWINVYVWDYFLIFTVYEILIMKGK